jgi:hypothetical protein
MYQVYLNNESGKCVIVEIPDNIMGKNLIEMAGFTDCDYIKTFNNIFESIIFAKSNYKQNDYMCSIEKMYIDFK